MSHTKEISWIVPKIWDKNTTCYIIGGGPSISNYNLNLLKGKRSIITNNVYQLMPWADFLFFMDKDWIKKHCDNISKLHCIKFTIVPGLSSYQKKMNLKFIVRVGAYGFSGRQDRITHGGNSGYCALQLGYLFGARRFILVGFDMRTVNKQHNYHNQHKRKMDADIYETNYIKHFESLRNCKDSGVEIINTTPNSALTCFPFMDFEEIIFNTRREKDNSPRKLERHKL